MLGGRRTGIVRWFAIAAIAALMLACEPAAASDFSDYLSLGYRQVASLAGTKSLVRLYGQRSTASANGEAIAPLVPDPQITQDLNFDAAKLGREALLDSLRSGAHKRQPLLAAIAQVNFDCWVMPLPRRKGAPTSNDCKSRFYFALQGCPRENIAVRLPASRSRLRLLLAGRRETPSLR